MKDSLNAAVIGATGYVGLELIKILSKHPNVKIVYLCAKKTIGKNIAQFDKTLKKKLPKISVPKKMYRHPDKPLCPQKNFLIGKERFDFEGSLLNNITQAIPLESKNEIWSIE